MGLSILIPVYNSHVKELVETLLQQAKLLQIPFEILLLDDCSELSISYLNLKLNTLDNVNYSVLSENTGRSKARNQLFEMAQYEYCLIMDGDVGIPNVDFLKNYWDNLQENDVIVGGHKYSALPPLEKEKYLHWLYGTKVEVQSLEKRINSPYNSFKTVCFGIKKEVFLQIKFDENIREYGHEDTLFGIALESQKISIKHIENPVIHLGIDTIETFLNKQKNAVHNLKKLYQETKINKLLKRKIKLIKIAEVPLSGKLTAPLKKIIYKNLRKAKPNLWALQIQKLIWWHSN